MVLLNVAFIIELRTKDQLAYDARGRALPFKGLTNSFSLMKGAQPFARQGCS